MRRMATFGLPPYQNFTVDEMEEATNNFDPANLVGEGSQGQVKNIPVPLFCCSPVYDIV